MKHMLNRVRQVLAMSLALVLMLMSPALSPQALGEGQSEVDSKAAALKADQAMAETIGCKPGKVLEQLEWFVPGDSISDWMAILLSVNGIKEDYDTYLKRLEEHVSDRYAANGCLDSERATEYHRIALTVMALGGDPEAFGKHADGSPVNLIAEGIYDYPGDLGAQGINGYIWALIALDAWKKDVPEGADHTREDIIGDILVTQMENGAFGFTSDPDADITAMTIQALAPYKDDRQEVGQAVDKALEWLAAQVEDDCGIPSYGVKNPESAAQAVIALTALGKDPEKEEAFVRGGQTLLTQLDKFSMGDGTYYHSQEAMYTDYLATEQVLLALTSVDMLRRDGSRLYELAGAGQASKGGSLPIPLMGVGLAVVLVIGLLAAVLGKKKKAS